MLHQTVPKRIDHAYISLYIRMTLHKNEEEHQLSARLSAFNPHTLNPNAYMYDERRQQQQCAWLSLGLVYACMHQVCPAVASRSRGHTASSNTERRYCKNTKPRARALNWLIEWHLLVLQLQWALSDELHRSASKVINWRTYTIHRWN